MRFTQVSEVNYRDTFALSMAKLRLFLAIPFAETLKIEQTDIWLRFSLGHSTK
jgi:hypothetical protein